MFLGRYDEDGFKFYIHLTLSHMLMLTQSLVIKIELDNQFNLKICQLYKITDSLSFSLNLLNILYQIDSAKRIKIILCVDTAQFV